MKWMIIAVVIIGILFSIYEAKIKGFIGEKAISILINGLPEDKYRVMNNIMLRSSHGLTQVDHIIVSVYGIFVIETKNYKGWITGGENSENWTKNVFGHKYKFRNPLKQNYAHVKALMELLDITDKNVFIPVVAFSGYADLKVKTNQNVIYYGELKGLIKEHTKELLTYEQMNEYADKIAASNVDSKENRREHIGQIHEAEAVQRAAENGICPKCGKQLVLRNGKFGQFWGCTGYPSCKYTHK